MSLLYKDFCKMRLHCRTQGKVGKNLILRRGKILKICAKFMFARQRNPLELCTAGVVSVGRNTQRSIKVQFEIILTVQLRLFS